MSWDAQAVMLLRSLRIAQGGAQAKVETTRMIRSQRLLKLRRPQQRLRSQAARNIAWRKRRWGFMRGELAATGAGSGSNGALGLSRED
jgi:hypothetical protein